MSIHHVHVEIFDRISENSDPLVLQRRKSQGIAKVIRIRPLGTISVCTKVQGNPSSSC